MLLVVSPDYVAKWVQDQGGLSIFLVFEILDMLGLDVVKRVDLPIMLLLISSQVLLVTWLWSLRLVVEATFGAVIMEVRFLSNLCSQ